MAVSTTTNFISYTGNGSASIDYPIPFPFLSASHLVVRKVGTLSTVSDPPVIEEVDETLSSSEYTVVRAGDGLSGTLRTVEATPPQLTLSITRLVPFTQPTVLPVSGPLRSSAIEQALDRLTMMAQQLATTVIAIGGDAVGGILVPADDSRTDEIRLAETSLVLTEFQRYQITASFSANGVFSDRFIDARLSCGSALPVISPEQNTTGVGAASWVVYLKQAVSGAALDVSCDFTATIRGVGWNGAASTNLAATWDMALLPTP